MNLREPVRFTDLAIAMAESPTLRQEVIDFLASREDDAPIVLEEGEETAGQRIAEMRARRRSRAPRPVRL